MRCLLVNHCGPVVYFEFGMVVPAAPGVVEFRRLWRKDIRPPGPGVTAPRARTHGQTPHLQTVLTLHSYV